MGVKSEGLILGIEKESREILNSVTRLGRRENGHERSLRSKFRSCVWIWEG